MAVVRRRRRRRTPAQPTNQQPRESRIDLARNVKFLKATSLHRLESVHAVLAAKLVELGASPTITKAPTNIPTDGALAQIVTFARRATPNQLAELKALEAVIAERFNNVG